MRLLLRKLDNMQEKLIATRKLVQHAKQGKPRFSQMLDKVHPPLKMTLRTVDPVIPKQLQGAVGERQSTDCDSDQTTLGAQPAPTLAANHQDVLTQGARPAPSTKRHDVVIKAVRVCHNQHTGQVARHYRKITHNLTLIRIPAIHSPLK